MRPAHLLTGSVGDRHRVTTKAWLSSDVGRFIAETAMIVQALEHDPPDFPAAARQRSAAFNARFSIWNGETQAIERRMKRSRRDWCA